MQFKKSSKYFDIEWNFLLVKIDNSPIQLRFIANFI